MDFESETYRKPAERKSQEDPFATCPDSRVIPALITGTRSGMLFELPSTGNTVPPRETRRPAGAADTVDTVEFPPDVAGPRRRERGESLLPGGFHQADRREVWERNDGDDGGDSRPRC
jgi:hypothetical protein